MSTRSDAIEDEALPRRMLARVLGLQYVVGGALTLTWVLAPYFGPAQGRDAVLSLALIALALGAAMAALSCARVSDRTLLVASHACILSSQVVIGLVHAATGTAFGPMLLFFLWTTPYAAIFSARARAVHVGSSAVAMTSSVIAVPASGHERAVSIVFIMAAMISITVLVSRLTWALRRQASTDALTGLPNRRAFQTATRAALARSRTHGTRVFVLLIDLDRFKNINDTYGHHAGDALLQQIAPRLVSELRSGHLVARLGGDEFAVLGEDDDPLVEVEAIAARLGEVCARPVQLPQGQVFTTASIGVALADEGDTADTLLRNADTAMYAAKAAGAAGARVYDRQMHEASAYAMHLESELRAAVAAEELHVAYQPVVGLAAGRVTGAEALLRWTHPVHGPIGPTEFIPLAETTGVIGELGHWVLRQALTDLAHWRRTGAVDDRFCVAVNVSAAQLTEQLPDQVAQLLADSGVPPRCLGLELTESAVMAGQGAEQTLHRLRELGVVLLLDDFGTGYSSLSHLLQFSFDTIKIDRSFVVGVAQPSAQRTIVLAILSLARSLDKHVVAEGVETCEHAAQLRRAGCNAAQGYLFSRPVPAEELPGVVARLDGVTGAPSAAALARVASSTAAV